MGLGLGLGHPLWAEPGSQGLTPSALAKTTVERVRRSERGGDWESENMAITSLNLPHSSPSASYASSSSSLCYPSLSLLLPRVLISRRFSYHGDLFRGSTRSATYPIASGTCRASQAVDLFPSLSPEVTIRDARLEDCWEVADTHCSCFFPDYTFPIDLVLRIDRFVGLLSGFSVPPGCMRTCLVAVTGPVNDNLYIGCEDFKVGGFEGKFSINRGSVAGILTIDTVADFLPRKGPLRQRRTGIAYISNVAVRETDRRRGIAKMLINKAETRARSWGCRSVALHCDVNNLAALRLYKGLGFKCIRVPENAKWPEPKTSPGLQFHFMMKLVTPKASP